MQMINVLQRLAELDANNSNVINEMEDSTAMSADASSVSPTSNHPANINITAGSGEEVGSMLAAIMKLAGVVKVSDEHMGVEHEPAIMTAEPSVGAMPAPMSAGDDMRSVLDKLNPEDDEKETDESIADRMFNNSPDEEVEGPNAFTDHGDLNKNPAMGGDVAKDHDHRSRVRNQPTATMEQQLMDEYKEFVVENDLASQILAMAPKARLRGSEGEEIERRNAMLAQRKKDEKNRSVPPTPSAEEIANAKEKLAQLDRVFDKNYQYSDDHSVYSKNQDIEKQISSLKKFIERGQHGVEESDEDSYLSKSDESNESAMEDHHESGEEYHSDSMAVSNLETIAREVAELSSILNSIHELPDWVEDKIAQVKGMVVGMSEYMKSETDSGDEHDQQGVAEGSEHNVGGISHSIIKHPGGRHQVVVKHGDKVAHTSLHNSEEDAKKSLASQVAHSKKMLKVDEQGVAETDDDDKSEKIQHLMQKYGWSRQEASEYLNYEKHDPKDWEDMA